MPYFRYGSCVAIGAALSGPMLRFSGVRYDCTFPHDCFAEEFIYPYLPSIALPKVSNVPHPFDVGTTPPAPDMYMIVPNIIVVEYNLDICFFAPQFKASYFSTIVDSNSFVFSWREAA